MLTDEFRKGVAFVEDQNKRWTTICTHPSGGDLLKDKNLRALINEGFQPNVSCAATASSSQAALLATAASVEKGLVHSRSDCRRSMLQHIMSNGGCFCLCDA